MAAATVDSSASDHHINHLHSESIPLIDLSLLSQSELFALSLCSSSSSIHHHRNDPDVSTLKIDRSVFNESAGSRKQTFSRLRLAPRNNLQFPSSSIKSPIPNQYSELSLDEESSQIVSVLKSLFCADSRKVDDNDDNLVSVPVQFNSFLDSNDAIRDVSMPIADSTTKKRKRGRPRRNESISNSNYNNYNDDQVIESIATEENVVEKEKVEVVMPNVNGAKIESMAMEDPYVEELRRRTMGMHTREQLLEFLQGFSGEWLSKRKKRKIVDASLLGNALPQGWRIMLCIKNRAGYFWTTCKRYISPNGQQFISCKEASSYLKLSLGLQDAIQQNFSPVDGSVQLMAKISSGNAADLTPKVDKNEGGVVSYPGFPVAESVEHEKQTLSLKVGISGQVQTVGKYNCHKCTAVFDEADDFLQHLLSSHQRAQKRLGQGTFLNEEVIIKNGKYECQLCHKPFEERHRYNGHFGNHIKDYFKRIEASGEAMTIQRRTTPTLVAVHPNNVKIQESTEIDMAVGAEANDELSYGVPNCKIKENTTVESYCGKQGMVCSIIGDKAGNTNDVAVGTSTWIGPESAVANNDNISICKSSNETNVPKCTLEGITSSNNIQEAGSQHCSTTVGREQISAVDNCVNQVWISLIEGRHQELGHDDDLLAPNSIEKVFDDENIKDRALSSMINGMKIHGKDLVGKDTVRDNCSAQEDVAANFKDQINPQGFSLISSLSDQRYASVDNVHELSTSTAVDMMCERGHEEGLPSCLDEKTCISSSKVNKISSGTPKESRFDGRGNSGNNELTGFGRKNVTIEDSVTSNQLESSLGCFVNPILNENITYTENGMNKASECTREKHWQEKTSEGRQLALFGCEQYLGSENEMSKISPETTKVSNHDKVLCLHNNMCSNDIDHIAGHITSIKPQNSSSNSLVVPSGNEMTFALKDNEVLNGTSKNLVQNKISDSNAHKTFCDGQILSNENDLNKASLIMVNQPQYKEVKSSSNEKVRIAFDHSHIERDANGGKSTMQDSCSKDSSLHISLSHVVENNVTGICSSPLEENIRTSEGFLYLSNSELDSVGDNSNRVLTGKVQEEPRLEDFNLRKNGLVTAFSSDSQASENAISEFMLKTHEENNLVTSFTDPSSRPVHSSGFFSTYDLISDKGGNELFGRKFGGISGFEGLRSGNMENMEYNSMTNHADESDIFSCDTEIAQGLGSSVWLDKEALPLLQKIASRRRVPALCVWCRNEFHHDAFESGAQIGSMSFTCADCKAKFSGQFNII